MKTERRHELESNTLAKELGNWSEKLRPYSSGILMGLAAVLACYAALSYWNSHGQASEKAAWDEYQQALLQGDVDFRSVRRVAEKEELAGSHMQEFAYITWADRQLRLAADVYLVDRKAANDRLDAVVAVYEQLAETASDPDVKSRAQLGLARVSEVQNKLDKAKEQYAAVVGVMAPVAEARLNELKSSETAKDALDWLATAELPTPPAPSGGRSGVLPGTRPDFGTTPPSSGGATDPFDPSKTMDEILGGGTGGRYGEAPTGGATSGDATPAGTGAAPATGDAGASAPSGTSAPPADNPAAPTGEHPSEGAILEPGAGATPAAK